MKANKCGVAGTMSAAERDLKNSVQERKFSEYYRIPYEVFVQLPTTNSVFTASLLSGFLTSDSSTKYDVKK